MNKLNLLIDLKKHANPEIAKNLSWFFKTGKGQYGEGDVFLGIKVPVIRQIIRSHEDISLDELQLAISSKYHEARMASVLILGKKYQKSKNQDEKLEIVNFYLKNLQYVNNWDLVDLSCIYILGDWLLDKDRAILYQMAVSDNIWERRISIIATAAFIRVNQPEDTLKISEILLKDKHDLIHKAVGWMLREVGKRDKKKLTDFLDKYSHQMPRTMLRYSIEKLPEKERKYYLNK